jgi:DNA (cytosine-5)-methyltransferase 1
MMDKRAQTVVSTLTLVRRFLPKAVLFENVRGFIQGQRSALGYLREEFEDIERTEGARYTLHVKVVNAADFGVPQNRYRAIVVAIRDQHEFLWPEATHSVSPLTAWDALWDVRPSRIPEPKGKWSSLLPLIPEGQNYLWLTSRGGGPELFGYRTKYWNFLLKLAHDRPSWTLPASPGPSTGPFHWDNRPLAVEEQLRLQSFPDEWEVSGTFREQTLQIGNATPVLLAEVLGRSVVRALADDLRSTAPLVRGPAAVTRRPAAVATVVPRHFVSLVGEKAAHAGEGRGPAGREVLAG